MSDTLNEETPDMNAVSPASRKDMEQAWKYYNKMPTLLEAYQHFLGHEAIFVRLAQLLSRYDHTFGVCLIHTHCTLSPGEIMLDKGENTTEPTHLSDITTTCYAKSWLPSGAPFEFTSNPTRAPPDTLINDFRALTLHIGLLGLYFAADGNDDDDDGIRLEWTEGRKNRVRRIQEEDWRLDPIETAWNLGRGDPLTMACILLCARATTESGGAHLKKKQHHQVQ